MDLVLVVAVRLTPCARPRARSLGAKTKEGTCLATEEEPDFSVKFVVFSVPRPLLSTETRGRVNHTSVPCLPSLRNWAPHLPPVSSEQQEGMIRICSKGCM